MKHLIGLQSGSFWFDALIAGQAFAMGASLEPTVGQVNEVQLLNPAASGVTVVVYHANAVVPAGSLAQWNRYDTALATLKAAGTNLLIGGAAGAAQVRTAGPAAADGVEITGIRIQDPAPLTRSPEWIFQIPQGVGVLATTLGANVRMAAEFYWVELPA